MIKAKTVVPNQFWILRKDDKKVGNIQADGQGYEININGKKAHIDDLSTLAKTAGIDFEIYVRSKPVSEFSVHGFPTSSHPYNEVFDVRHQLPLWTQQEKSRSWLSAGWYRIQQHHDWKVVFCPKLILLERYEYQGPFRSIDEAKMI